MTAEPTVKPLDRPAEGVPPVLTTQAEVLALADRLAQASDPIAWDAERASGYRYSQRAYLVQGRRAGVGSFLIDPIEVPDLSPLAQACGDAEWVLHAASQDLPCLRELGLVPGGTLFDTELGARIAGYERVGLGYMVEETLGLKLAKEHSAVDWSTRPLPEPWLLYAALDVEVLVELRDQVAARLERDGKLAWAYEEFDAVKSAPPAPTRLDPWRRTSGTHAVRAAHQQAVVRELWLERDRMAIATDIAPGRILPDRAIVAAVKAMPKTLHQLSKVTHFGGSHQRPHLDIWFAAIERARALPPSEYPGKPPKVPGPPAPKMWTERNPAAARRLKAAKALLGELSEKWQIPLENLMQPDAVRRVCWEPLSDVDPEPVAEQFRQLGARAWQVDLLVVDLVLAWSASDAA